MAPAHGFRRGIVARRGARALLRDRSLAHPGSAFGYPCGGRARSWPITARNSYGGPGLDREPPAAEGASPWERGSRKEREKHERARSARAGLDRGSPAPRERRLVAPTRSFPSCHGVTPVRPGGPGGASLTACRTRAGGARRTPGVRKGSGSHAGTETGRELRPGRGATPGPRMDASTWTVEDEATGHAERELRASKKRAPGPDQPSGRTSTTGRRRPSPSDEAQRHELPPSSAGQPDGGGPIPTTPPAEVERVERGSDDRGEHGASAQPRETA
jgi:hypothetical protein